VNAQWKFLQSAKDHGILDAVPDQQKHALLIENGK
jgi:hypothetical protein